MCGVVLLCGQSTLELPDPTKYDAVRKFDAVSVPAQPTKVDVDPLLEDNQRLVVVGTDADLAAVIVRLLRKERLGSTAVGFVPAGNSVATQRWNLPTNPESALLLALSGEAKPLALIRDDSGGVLIGQGILNQVQGEAYCDEHLMLRGRARSIVVDPTPNGVSARIITGSLRRKNTSASGRAFQLGCRPAELTVNGQVHKRPIRRWTWYRHTEDLQLVRGED
jgi:hypothetical protein